MTIALVICEIGEIYVPDMLVWSSQHSVHVARSLGHRAATVAGAMACCGLACAVPERLGGTRAKPTAATATATAAAVLTVGRTSAAAKESEERCSLCS